MTKNPAQGFSEDPQAAFEAKNAPLFRSPAKRERVALGAAGRLVIPAAMREEMGVKPGDLLVLRVEDGELRVIGLGAVVRRVQAMARAIVPEGASIVDEFIAERREEARSEAEEADAWRKAHGLPPLE